MASPRALAQAAKSVAGARIPVLLVSGGWSPAVDAVARHVARAIGSQQTVAASPNHFPQLENPDGFNRTVEAFMRESDAAAVNGRASPAP